MTQGNGSQEAVFLGVFFGCFFHIFKNWCFLNWCFFNWALRTVISFPSITISGLRHLFGFGYLPKRRKFTEKIQPAATPTKFINLLQFLQIIVDPFGSFAFSLAFIRCSNICILVPGAVCFSCIYFPYMLRKSSFKDHW